MLYSYKIKNINSHQMRIFQMVFVNENNTELNPVLCIKIPYLSNNAKEDEGEAE